MRATRAQADRVFIKRVSSVLENTAEPDIFQQPVDDLIVERRTCYRCCDSNGSEVLAPSGGVNGGYVPWWRYPYRWKLFEAGVRVIRLECLADRLRELPFRVDRLKTGTPPRIDGSTLIIP